MATPKSWTAYDLALGALKITRTVIDETTTQAIRFEQRYQYEDDVGGILIEIPGKRLVNTMALVDIPSNILTSLTTINNWLYEQALLQEGMND